LRCNINEYRRPERLGTIVGLKYEVRAESVGELTAIEPVHEDIIIKLTSNSLKLGSVGYIKLWGRIAHKAYIEELLKLWQSTHQGHRGNVVGGVSGRHNKVLIC
jgi:hypothetical protein